MCPSESAADAVKRAVKKVVTRLNPFHSACAEQCYCEVAKQLLVVASRKIYQLRTRMRAYITKVDIPNGNVS